MVRNRIEDLDDFRKQLEGADIDLLREMVKLFAEQLMGADADALCGADYGERSRACEPPQRLPGAGLGQPTAATSASPR